MVRAGRYSTSNVTDITLHSQKGFFYCVSLNMRRARESYKLKLKTLKKPCFISCTTFYK